jgi:hypothetical protein
MSCLTIFNPIELATTPSSKQKSAMLLSVTKFLTNLSNFLLCNFKHLFAYVTFHSSNFSLSEFVELLPEMKCQGNIQLAANLMEYISNHKVSSALPLYPLMLLTHFHGYKIKIAATCM